ncbi:hypothetical protein SAMN02745135_00444 [Caloranaerobacter azorensis DSM 13643]|uniref:Uncharacterized protein n=1 Tax=Caloranaerobacter azorensis DSM 13643 TaxID=1121264 RepID=A0A1M5S285_9FIRM|nr:hypothetical protein [Caloranaerobacter azorensis]SHH32579.1 hypothetical protein SAMN02745135_00444 [Caloranaerobacter azorensis DSM 13643]
MKASKGHVTPKVTGTGDVVAPEGLFLGLVNVAVAFNAIWAANVYTHANANVGANANAAVNANAIYNVNTMG